MCDYQLELDQQLQQLKLHLQQQQQANETWREKALLFLSIWKLSTEMEHFESLREENMNICLRFIFKNRSLPVF